MHEARRAGKSVGVRAAVPTAAVDDGGKTGQLDDSSREILPQRNAAEALVQEYDRRARLRSWEPHDLEEGAVNVERRIAIGRARRVLRHRGTAYARGAK